MANSINYEPLHHAVLYLLSFPLNLIEIFSSTPTSRKEEGLSFTPAQNNQLNIIRKFIIVGTTIHQMA
jgi:hypothetical protein